MIRGRGPVSKLHPYTGANYGDDRTTESTFVIASSEKEKKRFQRVRLELDRVQIYSTQTKMIIYLAICILEARRLWFLILELNEKF